MKQLVEVISKQPEKTAKLAALGSLVKKPEGINKLSVFIKSKPALFKVDDKAGTVTLV